VADNTPGPWSHAPAGVIIGADGRRICIVPARLDESDIADGDLIAAAPELLEAAVTARDILKPYFDEPLRTAFWKLADAIAKAKGAL